MKNEVLEKVSALMVAAFGLVAALAWNDAIKALFKGPCGTEGAGALCHLSSGGPWVYALIVTLIAVFATIWIGRVSERTKKVSLREAARRAQQRLVKRKKKGKKK